MNDVEYATLTWVDCYNNQRLLESIGNIPPMELEQAYYKQPDRQAMAVRLTPTCDWRNIP